MPITKKAGELPPFQQIEFGFRSVYAGLLKRDWETNRGVVDLVVVGKVAHCASKTIGVYFDFVE